MTEEKLKKPWYKRWWAITLFVIIGLNILVGITTPSQDKLKQEQTATPLQEVSQLKNVAPPPESVVAKPVETKTYAVGDTVQAGDFTWKIVKFSTFKQIGQYYGETFMGEKADGIFIVVDVEVENTGKSAQYLTDSFLKLIDDQDREFSPNSVAAIYLQPQGSALTFETINPGIVKKGRIVFDVPVGLKVANIQISSNLVESSFYTIKLMT